MSGALAGAVMLAALLTSSPQPCAHQLSRAIEHVESRGNTMAKSPTGARGLWQVQPQWSSFPAWALHIPAVSRWEGCRILRRWEKRAVNRCAYERKKGSRCNVTRRTLAAYNAGVHGLRGRSSDGEKYASAVLSRISGGTHVASRSH